jgi:hypothetical protein
LPGRPPTPRPPRCAVTCSTTRPAWPRTTAW